jgi:hypothetical protein
MVQVCTVKWPIILKYFCGIRKIPLSLVPGSLIDAAAAMMLLLVAVVGDVVGCALDIVSDLGTGLPSEALDEAGDLSRTIELLEAHEVGGETGNVRRGYETC